LHLIIYPQLFHLLKILIFPRLQCWRFVADEYRKTIEKDAALERRFQPVTVEEPTVESTISILRGLKPKYEVHHGVEISDAALVTGELQCWDFPSKLGNPTDLSSL
jgi:hypothetical protein